MAVLLSWLAVNYHEIGDCHRRKPEHFDVSLIARKQRFISLVFYHCKLSMLESKTLKVIKIHYRLKIMFQMYQVNIRHSEIIYIFISRYILQTNTLTSLSSLIIFFRMRYTTVGFTTASNYIMDEYHKSVLVNKSCLSLTILFYTQFISACFQPHVERLSLFRHKKSSQRSSKRPRIVSLSFGCT